MRPHIYARHAKRVNTQLVVAAARGLIIAGNRSLLVVDYGGNLNPEKAWAKSLLRHMGFVKRNVLTSARVAVQDFEGIGSWRE
jgi:hypothetical protein